MIVANDVYIILFEAKKKIFDGILVEISIQFFSFWIREKSSFLVWACIFCECWYSKYSESFILPNKKYLNPFTVVYERNKNLWQNCIYFYILFLIDEFSRHFFAFFYFWNIMDYIILYKIKVMNKNIKKFIKRIKKFRRNYDSNRNIFVVCIAIVMIWRWLWNILDMFIFPNHPFLSNLVCITIWVAILLIDDWRLWELEQEDSHKEKNMK